MTDLDGIYGAPPPQRGIAPGMVPGEDGRGLPSQKGRECSCPSGCVCVCVGTSSTNPAITHTRTEGDSTLADVLLECGVLLMSRPKRLELAALLSSAGITSADVLALARYLSEMMPEDPVKAKRILAGKLMDAKERSEAIEDLKRHHAIVAARAAANVLRATEHYWGFPSPYVYCACEGCEARRRAGHQDVRS